MSSRGIQWFHRLWGGMYPFPMLSVETQGKLSCNFLCVVPKAGHYVPEKGNLISHILDAIFQDI